MNTSSGRTGLFLILAVFFISQTSFSQWQWVNPKPQGNTIHDMQFVSATTGFAAGDGGTILKTTDYGHTWNRLESGRMESLNSVFFLDSLTGWAIANEWETLLKTVDGGITWDVAYVFSTFQMNDVWFTDAMHGVAVGYECVFITSDGGAHWLWKGPYTWNYSIWFTSPSTAVMSSEYLLYKSYDGGNTWTVKQSNAYGWRGSLFFMKADTGFHVGRFGKIWRTTDGGEHWDTVHSGTSQWLSAAYILPDGTGYIVGYAGTMLKTTNAGVSWTLLPPLTDYNLETITFSDSIHGVISGELGYLMVTDDGGLTATSLYSTVTKQNLNTVVFPDQNTGYAAGSGSTILKSTDGGNSWEKLPVTDSSDFNSLWFQGDQTGYAAGTKGKIFKTTNGGASWTSLNSGVVYSLSNLVFPEPQTGYAIANATNFSDSVFLLKTTDAGLNWTRTPIGYNTFFTMVFTSTDTGYIAGYDGTIKQTTDGGNTWNTQASIAGIYFYDLCFPTKNRGFACGYGVIYQTNDAGLHWNPLFSGPLIFKHMIFINPQIGYALASDGYSGGWQTLFKTEDGGVTWSDKVIDETGYWLNDLSFTAADSGVVAGNNGVILKTANAGGIITGLEQGNPRVIPHAEIFPNPCSDKFQLQFPEIQNSVGVQIYSISGNEVYSSVFTGVKTISLQNPAQPAGIYFVRIRTGNGVVVKKLIVD